MDIALDLPFGLFLDDIDKPLGIFVLHAAFDFFQRHLPQIFCRSGRLDEPKDKGAHD
jgi:hypothetical protein